MTDATDTTPIPAPTTDDLLAVLPEAVQEALQQYASAFERHGFQQGAIQYSEAARRAKLETTRDGVIARELDLLTTLHAALAPAPSAASVTITDEAGFKTALAMLGKPVAARPVARTDPSDAQVEAALAEWHRTREAGKAGPFNRDAMRAALIAGGAGSAGEPTLDEFVRWMDDEGMSCVEGADPSAQMSDWWATATDTVKLFRAIRSATGEPGEEGADGDRRG